MSIRKVQFNPRKQLRFINNQGQRILYYKSFRCACFDEDSGNRDIHCPYCDVDGYRYDCAIPTTAIITGIQDQHVFTTVGEIKAGDCIGGFPWQIPVKFHDKVVLYNKRVQQNAMLIESEIHPPKLDDHIICQLDDAHTLNKTYKPYVDFVIDTDHRTVVWVDSNNKPEDGEKFTLSYWHRPVYIVWSVLPLERHSENKIMPKHVVLRRKDDFGNDLGRNVVSQLPGIY